MSGSTETEGTRTGTSNPEDSTTEGRRVVGWVPEGGFRTLRYVDPRCQKDPNHDRLCTTGPRQGVGNRATTRQGQCSVGNSTSFVDGEEKDFLGGVEETRQPQVHGLVVETRIPSRTLLVVRVRTEGSMSRQTGVDGDGRGEVTHL